ncbi:hypothetical protein [Almyronema epifaneia]|uniref:Uncharacterized protein n=1 Tax=Almyronema epifaneia S1 TaxID=2991925 RepID=A0ABW6IF27_9CYAN
MRHLGEAEPVRLTFPRLQPERERLRHLIVGSNEGVRSAIHTLHQLRYAEQAQWSPILTIPTSGILLTPEQGEVFSYLLRYRQLS